MLARLFGLAAVCSLSSESLPLVRMVNMQVAMLRIKSVLFTYMICSYARLWL